MARVITKEAAMNVNLDKAISVTSKGEDTGPGGVADHTTVSLDLNVLGESIAKMLKIKSKSFNAELSGGRHLFIDYDD